MLHRLQSGHQTWTSRICLGLESFPLLQLPVALLLQLAHALPYTLEVARIEGLLLRELRLLKLISLEPTPKIG